MFFSPFSKDVIRISVTHEQKRPRQALCQSAAAIPWGASRPDTQQWPPATGVRPPLPRPGQAAGPFPPQGGCSSVCLSMAARTQGPSGRSAHRLGTPYAPCSLSLCAVRVSQHLLSTAKGPGNMQGKCGEAPGLWPVPHEWEGCHFVTQRARTGSSESLCHLKPDSPVSFSMGSGSGACPSLEDTGAP